MSVGGALPFSLPSSIATGRAMTLDAMYSEPHSGEIMVKVAHLPMDMSPREFKHMFLFSRAFLSAEYHAQSNTGFAFFNSSDGAVEARDVLAHRADESLSVRAEIVSHMPLSSSSSSSTASLTNGHNRQAYSPPTATMSSLHISPSQRQVVSPPPQQSQKSGYSISSGKQFILGEEPDNFHPMLSPQEEYFGDGDAAFADQVRPTSNRRTSSHIFGQLNGHMTNGNGANLSGLPALNGFNSNAAAYPPPLTSPGLQSSGMHSPGVTSPTFSGNSLPRPNTPPMPVHHFSHHPYPRVLPAANPADQNPPCNTLYVGNLPMNTSEDELKLLFSRQRGYKRLCFRTKSNGPMCFVEFEDVAYATRALTELYGRGLSNSVKGGIRLSFSKNPLGVRNESDRRISVQQSQPQSPTAQQFQPMLPSHMLQQPQHQQPQHQQHQHQQTQQQPVGPRTAYF